MSFLNSMQEKGKTLFAKIAPTDFSEQKQFAVATAEIISMMAMADGMIEESEIDTVANIIDGNLCSIDYLGIDASHAKVADTLSELQRSYGISEAYFVQTCDRMLDEIVNKVAALGWRHQLVDFAQEIAKTDGEISDNEKALLELIAKKLGAPAPLDEADDITLDVDEAS